MSRWWEYQNSHAQKISLKIFLLHTGVYHDVNASLNELDTYCFFHTFFYWAVVHLSSSEKPWHDFQLVKDFGEKLMDTNYD